MRKKNTLKLKKDKIARIVLPAIIFGIAILFISTFMFKAQASPASSISLEPATTTVAKDQTFSLDAKINPGTNQVTAVEMHLTFDANKFQISDISPSSVFSSVLQAGQYYNSAGTATVIVGIPAANPPRPVVSDSTVATITFRTIGQSGTFPIGFSAETKASALNETGDVIIRRTPAQITIGRRFGNADFAVLASDWLEAKPSDADVNTDGKINSQDLGIMMSNWGN